MARRAEIRRAAAGLVRASHAGPTVVVTGLSAALLASFGAPGRVVLLATAAVLSGQLSVGWSNDWLDAGRDSAVRRADKPVVAGVVRAATLRSCALLAAAACVVLSLATGLVPGAVHLAAVAGAWAYNLGVKRTVASGLPYVVSFGLLPVFLALAAGAAQVPWRLAAAGALLGGGAHVANALPDLEDDAATDVRGLPHRLGRRRSAVLAPILLVGATGLVVGSGAARVAVGVVAACMAVTAGVVGAVRPESRLPFALSMAVAAVCVGLLGTAEAGVVIP